MCWECLGNRTSFLPRTDLRGVKRFDTQMNIDSAEIQQNLAKTPNASIVGPMAHFSRLFETLCVIIGIKVLRDTCAGLTRRGNITSILTRKRSKWIRLGTDIGHAKVQDRD